MESFVVRALDNLQLLPIQVLGLSWPTILRLVSVGLALSTLLGLLTSARAGLQLSVVVWISSSLALGNGVIMFTILMSGGIPVRAVIFSIVVTFILPFGFTLGYVVGLLLSIRRGNESIEHVEQQLTLMKEEFLELALQSSLWRVLHADFLKLSMLENQTAICDDEDVSDNETVC